MPPQRGHSGSGSVSRSESCEPQSRQKKVPEPGPTPVVATVGRLLLDAGEDADFSFLGLLLMIVALVERLARAADCPN